MKLVVAVGGNALLRRGEPAEAALQKRNVEGALVVCAGGGGIPVVAAGTGYEAGRPYEFPDAITD